MIWIYSSCLKSGGLSTVSNELFLSFAWKYAILRKQRDRQERTISILLVMLFKCKYLILLYADTEWSELEMLVDLCNSQHLETTKTLLFCPKQKSREPRVRHR